jgi:hypothetical protein
MTATRELRIDDRREAIAQRRKSPRARLINSARIIWSNGAPVRCTVRNLSRTEACFEVREPVPEAFDLILDAKIWRKAFRIGVKFT